VALYKFAYSFIHSFKGHIGGTTGTVGTTKYGPDSNDWIDGINS